MAQRNSGADARGVVVQLGEQVEGLGSAPGDSLWLGRSVAERQERAFIGGGARPGPDDPTLERLVVADDVVLFPATVKTLLEAGRARGSAVSFRPRGELGQFLAEAEFGRRDILAAYLPPGPACEPSQLAQLPVEAFDPSERLLDVPVHATQFGADLLQLPLSDRLLFPTRHWMQLLWANLLGLGPFLWRELAGKTVPGVIWNVGRAILTSASANPHRIGARLHRRGKGCRVHPTAVVEGSWLGDGVEVGAHAVVRGCVLADGAKVEDLADVEFSVLGRQALVQRQALLRYSLVSPGAACAGAVQLGVLGVDSAVKHGATLMDIDFAQGVRVRSEGGLHRAPLGIAGVCVGSRTVIGSGVQVAPGRAIPGSLVVVPPIDGILSRIPEPCKAGTWQVVDGGLKRT